jgi:DNA-binding MarR family transcriptional regulator
MTLVKRHFAAHEVHVPMLLGAFNHRVGRDYDPADWDGLRVSHTRVVTSVPPEGISITALAERVNMTKQGCGQFVTQLVESGHLRIEPAPGDRRLRLVFRTEAGERLIDKVNRHMAALEEGWVAEVGPRRYATFRQVLEELAFGG